MPDATTLTTMATWLACHESTVVNARLGIDDATPAEELAGHALAALVYQHALAERAVHSQWVNARDALHYGAPVDQVADAMGLEADEVRFGLSRWADGQRRHGLMSEHEHVDVLALVENGRER